MYKSIKNSYGWKWFINYEKEKVKRFNDIEPKRVFKETSEISIKCWFHDKTVMHWEDKVNSIGILISFGIKMA